MRPLEILGVLEAIATSMYEKTKDPYWKEQTEWIKEQKKRELELALTGLRL